MSAEVRSRFQGCADDIATALTEFATKPGWFKYCEEDGKGALNTKLLQSSRSAFVELHKLTENLSFTQKEMEKAMRDIGDKHAAEWEMSPVQLDEQAKVMAKRLRTACRHIAQALRKEPQPKWVKAIFDEAAPLDGNSELAEKDWPIWGWDPELEVGFRKAGLKPRDAMQTTKNIKEPEEAKVSDSMLAVFPDGREYELAEMTVEDWRLRSETQKAIADTKKHVQVLWQRKHEASGLQMQIRPRPDREMLCSLYLGTAQVCQVPLSAFSDMAAAASLLRVVGEAFCDSKIGKNEFYTLRDSEAKKLGISLRSRKTSKKPAAAGSDDATAQPCTAAASSSSTAAAASSSTATAPTRTFKKRPAAAPTEAAPAKKAAKHKPPSAKKAAKPEPLSAKKGAKQEPPSAEKATKQEHLDELSEEEVSAADGGISDNDKDDQSQSLMSDVPDMDLMSEAELAL